MSNQWLKPALIAAVILQLVIMTGVFVKGFYPLWLGQEVRLETRPVDPRDLFRGNYARLGYDFTTLDSADFRPGEPVFLPLIEEGDLWVTGEALHEPPEQGLYLRGRVTGPRWADTRRALFGIEALFAPKEKALALEKELRDGAVAVIKVAPNGRAALVRVNSE
ncbi:GDYXXLXY domain-containing protein [Alcanivorax sp. DP30]|uniref:GDYXXLXY domain-containing protein n=1 Tax=Alcanivorax sp. DP30 TaxID=2606217 RepID=UPI00136871CF|nr:GDYXXLXY domain-containing protein [Alcanivorax sp. DP30]MZR62214.1 hypothetical protein [Alcanivorax sp. DP30]